jgi:hypothetical protein
VHRHGAQMARFDGTRIVSATEALALPTVLKRMIVIGDGAIGLEMGSVAREVVAYCAICLPRRHAASLLSRSWVRRLRSSRL